MAIELMIAEQAQHRRFGLGRFLDELFEHQQQASGLGVSGECGLEEFGDIARDDADHPHSLSFTVNLSHSGFEIGVLFGHARPFFCVFEWPEGHKWLLPICTRKGSRPMM
jgi:hypothetical protein